MRTETVGARRAHLLVFSEKVCCIVIPNRVCGGHPVSPQWVADVCVLFSEPSWEKVSLFSQKDSYMLVVSYDCTCKDGKACNRRPHHPPLHNNGRYSTHMSSTVPLRLTD